MSSDENTKIAGLRAVTAQRISASDPGPEITDDACQLAIESALTIDVGNLDSFTLLCTPNDKRAMTVGFLFSEGVIDEVDDISLLRECEDDDDVMRVKLADPRKGAASEGRNLLIVSSCGMCGSESIEDRVAALPVVGETLKVPVETLWKVQRAMRNRQTLFDHSGGTHAAGIFDKNGEIVACRAGSAWRWSVSAPGPASRSSLRCPRPRRWPSTRPNTPKSRCWPLCARPAPRSSPARRGCSNNESRFLTPHR
jgi:hypothetical protein